MKKCPRCGIELQNLEESCVCGYSFWDDFTNEDKQTIYLRKIHSIMNFFFWLTLIGLGCLAIYIFVIIVSVFN